MKRVLIVDDNKLMREMLARILSEAGFITQTAKDGDDAIKSLKDFFPELVVLDVFLPGSYDGVKLCKLLREDERFSNVVIVMVTASDSRKEAEACLSAGANLLIPKPFSPRSFLAQVQLLLKEKGGANE